MWDGHCCAYNTSTTRSLASIFAVRLAGNPWWENETVVEAHAGPWNRTRIGADAGNPAEVEEYLGEVLEAAAWNVALNESERRMLALGQHPLSVRPAGLVGHWNLRTPYTRSWIGTHQLTATGEPRILTAPYRSVGRRVWRSMIGRPAGALVMEGYRMVAAA